MTLRISVFLSFLCLVFSINAQQAPPIPGLVGYWSFNGNANDISAGERNGSVSGAQLVEDRHGNNEGAYRFDGVDDRITLPSDLVLNLEQGFTISTWHKIPSGSKTSWSAYIGKSLSDGGKMMFHSGGNVTFYQAYVNPTYYIWSSGVNLGDEIPYDEWFHLAIVVKKRSGENRLNMKVYINGLKKRENNNMASKPDYNVFKILHIGRVQNRYYEGILDEVAVFDQPMESNQIEDLYTYAPTDGTWFTNNNGLFFNAGNVAIGTTDTQVDGETYKLAVDGKITTKEVNVTVDNWPDYVFDPTYELTSLEEVEAFIKANHHLPNVPAALEVENRGADLGEMNKILLRKMEELTLHLIEMNKEISGLKASNDELKKEIIKLKAN